MNGKIDCEKLMNALLPVAERMLREFGEFYPYGGCMKPNGEIIQVGAEDEDTDHPRSKDLIFVLRDSLSLMASTGQCKATAVVFDVRIDLPGTQRKCDAIQVSLEHAENYSAEVFLPYEISKDCRVIYGETFAQRGKRDIFGKD